uniref:CS domain-containing protein n=2 Tax=Plectus sambesii TaxID=2011161 RepID=A0A914XFM7_9BILA
MADFSEKNGIAECVVPWGRWWQTVDEVHIEASLDEPVTTKDLAIVIKNNRISLTVKGKVFFQGELCKVIQADESTWTLEDKKLIRILLAKANPGADNLWSALLANTEDDYAVHPFTLDEMQKKLTLERFQKEHPGMDFSGADITGNYHGGGPQLPQ